MRERVLAIVNLIAKYVLGANGAAISELMAKFKSEPVQLDEARWAKVRELFDSHACDDESTCDTIAKVHAETGYLLDPHTAIGVAAGAAGADG